MNFIKKSVGTISNAVEINELKSKRSKLNDEKKHLESSLVKYDEQIQMKQNIIQLIETNNDMINFLRNQFTKANINYDVPMEEFTDNNPESDNYVYKKLFDQLTNTNKSLENTVKHLDKTICVSREIYADRINVLDEQIKKLNEKLDKIREKQFGKH